MLRVTFVLAMVLFGSALGGAIYAGCDTPECDEVPGRHINVLGATTCWQFGPPQAFSIYSPFAIPGDILGTQGFVTREVCTACDPLCGKPQGTLERAESVTGCSPSSQVARNICVGMPPPR